MAAKRRPELSEMAVPKDVDSERRVLCEILTHGEQELRAAQAILVARDFFDGRHRVIFTALAEMERSGAPIEIGALRAHLEATGRLEEAGGAAYLGSLIE